MVHTFGNFQKTLENTIMVENAHKKMGEQKRKFELPGQFNNNSRPRFAPKGHLFALEDKMSTSGRINTSAPISRTTTSRLSMLVNQVAPQFSAESPEHSHWNTCEKQHSCSHWW
jgi:hypothetical protein